MYKFSVYMNRDGLLCTTEKYIDTSPILLDIEIIGQLSK